jgi:hypothetical protein
MSQKTASLLDGLRNVVVRSACLGHVPPLA